VRLATLKSALLDHQLCALCLLPILRTRALARFPVSQLKVIASALFVTNPQMIPVKLQFRDKDPLNILLHPRLDVHPEDALFPEFPPRGSLCRDDKCTFPVSIGGIGSSIGIDGFYRIGRWAFRPQDKRNQQSEQKDARLRSSLFSHVLSLSVHFYRQIATRRDRTTGPSLRGLRSGSQAG
jgi:hypothetical protein